MELKGPNSTAVRTALWRALHVQLDPPPHILNDTLGIRLIQPTDEWKKRPDMDPEFTRRVRLSIVTRARYVEDLVEEKLQQGIRQYIILGSGLDTFAQRRPDLMAQLRLFEIDDAETLQWKQQRLHETAMSQPENQHFVAVDFEKDQSWLDTLVAHGFDKSQPALIACTGVSLYLTGEAILRMFQQISVLPAGSLFAMTFLLPMELVDEEDKTLLKISMAGAERSGHPFRSFFTHDQIKALAIQGGFVHADVVSKQTMVQRYFAMRNDGLDPASGEDFLIALT